MWGTLTRAVEHATEEAMVTPVLVLAALLLSVVARMCLSMRRPENDPPVSKAFQPGTNNHKIGTLLLSSLTIYRAASIASDWEPVATELQEAFVRAVPGTFRNVWKSFQDYNYRSIKLGEYDAVVLHDLKAIKELLAKDETTGRWRYFQWDFVYFFQNVGVLFSDGARWRTNRRFCLKNLKDFGFGKSSSMEHLIKDEIQELIAEFNRSSGSVPSLDLDESKESRRQQQPGKLSFVTDLGDHFVNTVVNALWILCAGTRVERGDEEYKAVFDSLQVNFTPMTFFSLMPTLIKTLPGWVCGLPRLERDRVAMYSCMNRIVAEHRATRDPKSPRDLADMYLQLQADGTDPDGNQHLFTDLNLSAILLDLFAAGTETTTTSLKWFFLVMVMHPEMQERIQREIDEFVGLDRSPTWEDSNRLHYTQAVIHEVWRYICIVPMGLDHRLLGDVHFNEYVLPKGTVLLPNLYAILHDPDYWAEPEKFNPDRFLDSNGHFLRHPAMVAFGLGKRQCLGESLARMTMFLVATHLLQLFTFEKVAPESQYKLHPTPESQIVNLPHTFKVKVVPRSMGNIVG